MIGNNIKIQLLNNIITVTTEVVANKCWISIKDLSGRSVYKNKYTNFSEEQIPLSEATGVYIITVVADNQVEIEKIYINK